MKPFVLGEQPWWLVPRNTWYESPYNAQFLKGFITLSCAFAQIQNHVTVLYCALLYLFNLGLLTCRSVLHWS